MASIALWIDVKCKYSSSERAKEDLILTSILMAIVPAMENRMNPFTVRKVVEAHALYVAMCKGKVAQRSIHRKPVMGQGFSYHGAISID